MSLFGLALAAHLVADFPLQPNWMANKKTQNTAILTAHIAVHTAVLSLFIGALGDVSFDKYFALVVPISFLHYGIDVRRWVKPNEDWDSPMLWVWLNDQIMHIVVIAFTVSLVEMM